MQAELVEEKDHNMRQWLRDNLKGDPLFGLWWALFRSSALRLSTVLLAIWLTEKQTETPSFSCLNMQV